MHRGSAGGTGRAGAPLLCSCQHPRLGFSPLPPCSAQRLARARALPGAITLAGFPSSFRPTGFLLRKPWVSSPGWGRGGTPGLGALQAGLCLRGGGGRALSTQPQCSQGSMSRFGARQERRTQSSSPEANEGPDFGVPRQEGRI